MKTKPINDYLTKPEISTAVDDSQNAHITVTAPSPSNKYDSRWLNKEIRGQIELLQQSKTIVSQTQMYQYLYYSKAKFDYWMNKNGNMPLTQDLIKKRNELFEARLIDQGLNIKNWPFIIFLLKNNHGYADVKEINDNHNYQFNVTRGLNLPKQRKNIQSTSVTSTSHNV